MKWATGIILGTVFALTLWIMCEATQKVKVLKPPDLAVMEFHLRQGGNQVQVESGSLVVAGDEVLAVLNCRTDNGQVAFTLIYRLGCLDGRPILEKLR